MLNDFKTLDISGATMLRAVVIVLALFLVFAIWDILASLFLAVVIASALEPAVHGLSRTHLPRFLSVVLIYLFALGALAGIFYAVSPLLINDLRQLSADFPEQFARVQNEVRQFFGGVPGEGAITQEMQTFFNDLRGRMSTLAIDLFGFASSVFGGVMSFFLVLVISFYLALRERGVEKFLISFTPQAHQDYIIDLWRRVQKKTSRWLQGQAILIIFIAATLFPGLWLMGVKYAVLLAVIAALLEIIPVIGPLTAGAVIFFIVLLQAPPLALLATGYYVLLQQVQQYVIVPSVMTRAVGLNPVAIIIALLIGAKLAGLWGIVLAIPVAAVIGEFVRDLVKRE